jgi:uncharacterized repeat protein (TIGR01451 family)
MMRRALWLLAWGAVCAVCAAALAQTDATASSPASASASISAAGIAASSSLPAAASKSAASPIQTQFKAFKVHFLANGQEELESASGVSPGDVVAYVAVHRNASQRRLLNVDFAIPIPWGTTLWEGSVSPESGQLRMPDQAAQAGKANGMANAKPIEPGAKLPRVVWRVERLEPGQSVQLKLRVSIDPDPTLAPKPSPNPFRPTQPQLRKP